MKHITLLLLLLTVFAVPTYAADTISYTSQPDAIYVFLNNIALAHDTLTLPGAVDVSVVLPNTTFVDTLVIRENGERIPTYQIVRDSTNQVSIRWESAADSDVREVTLDYLLSGLSWKPKYDMWVQSEESVAFDFFVEFTNSALTLEDVELQLIAGQVDTAQMVDDVARVTANQYLAGYEEANTGSQSLSGMARIQHVYDVGQIDSTPGAVVYTQMQSSELEARRLLLWNAQTDREVTVIYKPRNDTELPFAEGIVRSYQDGLFLGSDFIERTPIGSEGSVTVGTLPDVRVSRAETQRRVEGPSELDDLHEITLTLENFGTDTVEIEVVDYYPGNALEFQFSDEPAPQGGNLYRWIVTLEPGASQEIQWSYKN